MDIEKQIEQINDDIIMLEGDLHRSNDMLEQDEIVREIKKLYDEKHDLELKLIETNTPEKYVRKISVYQHMCASIQIHKGKKYIVVPLPSANTDWTLKAFEFVKQIVTTECNRWGLYAYPEHGLSFMNTKCLYIYIN